LRRVSVQCADGFGQPRVGKTGHDAAVHQAMGHGVPQELDHQDLGQPVHHGAVPAAAGLCFAEQQLLREIEAGQLRQRHAQQGRQSSHQRVLVPGAEVDRGADDIGAWAFTAVKPVGTRARDEQHAGFVDDAAPPQRVGHAQRPTSHQVQVTHPDAAVEVGQAADRATVKDPGTQLEALKQRRQAVRHEMNWMKVETK